MAQSRKSGDRKPRAKPVENWLALIRPHMREYDALPQLARKQFIAALTKQTGTSDNTLRRFVAAAQFLEVFGITELPATRKRLPVGSVEAVARIAKKDLHRAQSLLNDLVKGKWSIEALKEELKKTPSVRRKPRNMANVYRDSEKRLIDLIYHEGRIDGDLFLDESPHTIRFYKDLGSVAPLFDSLAEPVLAAELRGRRWLVVFDESAVKWGTSAQRAQREFVRNILSATALFKLVIVFCSDMRANIELAVSLMDEMCCERVRIESGALHAKTIEGLLTGRAGERTRLTTEYGSP